MSHAPAGRERGAGGSLLGEFVVAYVLCASTGPVRLPLVVALTPMTTRALGALRACMFK